MQDLGAARYRYQLMVKRLLSNGTTTATYFGAAKGGGRARAAGTCSLDCVWPQPWLKRDAGTAGCLAACGHCHGCTSPVPSSPHR
jgi:cytosine/adenosine deaminase-related metal-dependent hydrolase